MYEQSMSAVGHARSLAPPLWRRLVWRLLIALGPVTRITWHVVDQYTIFRHPYLPLRTSADLVRVRAQTYEGPPFWFSDGTSVRAEMVFLELHFDSVRALELALSDSCGGRAFYTAFRNDLCELFEGLRAKHAPYRAACLRTRVRRLIWALNADVRPIPYSLHAALEQLFQEMAVIVFRPEDAYGRLCSHYAPTMETWFSLTTFSRERFFRTRPPNGA